MKFLFNGDLVQGGPVEIIEAIKSQAYDHERFQSLDEYMEWLKGSIWRFHGKGITIEGQSLEDRCKSLVEQLAVFQLLDPVKE